ncbi:helix-turn-helix transcriptional regulator [Streptomyces sp. B1866]|uniref:helix-turn-helix domain-containing protein n=1 Tax=Streptomyces sp. B1866 TaxID=3075431 RepID=UPI00288DFB52|nr:helix-turn-helix transcriptional regulator [Streptomyces sp. B1866]MDT3398083.1 helix-turn-helix transcriptional regulator [Streptomyces sp. B1866]
MAAEPTMRRRLLGMELRSLREGAGRTSEETADQMGWHPSKMTRLESGRSGLRVHEVTALLDFYGVTSEETRDTLEGLAREGKRRTWWRPYNDVLERQYTNLLAFESEAETVRNYELALVPGLLQTPDYARAITRALQPDRPSEKVNALVDVRLQRQNQALSREDPLSLWAIVDEAALRREVGSPAVMTRQVRALAEASERTNITLQVLPFGAGAHVALLGSFVIYGFPIRSDLDVVYVEGQAGSVYLEREQDRTTYGHAFDLLRADALGVDQTRDFLTRFMKEQG